MLGASLIFSNLKPETLYSLCGLWGQVHSPDGFYVFPVVTFGGHSGLPCIWAASQGTRRGCSSASVALLSRISLLNCRLLCCWSPRCCNFSPAGLGALPRCFPTTWGSSPSAPKQTGPLLQARFSCTWSSLLSISGGGGGSGPRQDFEHSHLLYQSSVFHAQRLLGLLFSVWLRYRALKCFCS